jgi:hypothetical protein
MTTTAKKNIVTETTPTPSTFHTPIQSTSPGSLLGLTASTNKNSIVTAPPKFTNIAIEPTSANSLQELDLAATSTSKKNIIAIGVSASVGVVIVVVIVSLTVVGWRKRVVCWKICGDNHSRGSSNNVNVNNSSSNNNVNSSNDVINVNSSNNTNNSRFNSSSINNNFDRSSARQAQNIIEIGFSDRQNSISIHDEYEIPNRLSTVYENVAHSPRPSKTVDWSDVSDGRDTPQYENVMSSVYSGLDVYVAPEDMHEYAPFGGR